MIFDTLKVGALGTNCYVISAAPPEALVIDAGGSADEIIAALESRKLRPTLLVSTHGHADHIVANAELKERYDDMEIAVGRRDADMITSPARNMSLFVGCAIQSPPADRMLDEDDRVEAAGLFLRVLDTPGHTPGGISLYLADLDGRPAVFVGDTLFSGSVGRCDIPGASWDALLASIRGRLFRLPDDTVVFPGHGPPTTIGAEKASNPFVGEDAP